MSASKKPDYPKVKWLGLTPEQLRHLASAMDDHAHDMGIDREQLLKEQGFDVVASYEALARRLRREAARRERIAEHRAALAPTTIKYTGRRSRLKLRRAK